MKTFRTTAVLLALLASLLVVFRTTVRAPLADNESESEGENARELTATIANLNFGGPSRYAVATDTPQFVLLSFDGSKSVAMLKKTLDFEQKMAAEAKPLHFTYFVNAAYFLTATDSSLYQAPGQPRGVSNIGFSDSAEDIKQRVAAFNQAVAAGNEIGSHSAGHFDGRHWSYQDWQQEFKSFQDILFRQAWTFKPEDIIGFRAPLLAVNDNLYRVLREAHFAYDASGVSSGRDWPVKDQSGLWRIPLGTVTIGPRRNRVLSMDYNLWYYQTQAENTLVKNTPEWNAALVELTTAYRDYFHTNYDNGRAPVVIGDHFSKWNDGLYWEALKSFAEEVCGQPAVRCTTFKELIDYLNTVGPPARLK